MMIRIILISVPCIPDSTLQAGKPREWIACDDDVRPERTKPARFVRDQRWKLSTDQRFFDVSWDPVEKYPIGEKKVVPANEERG